MPLHRQFCYGTVAWFVRDVIAVHVIIVQLVMSPEY